MSNAAPKSWDQIATDDVAAAEVRDLIRKRHAKASAYSLVWNFLFFFPMIRWSLVAKLLNGSYRFDWCQAFRPAGREEWVAIRPYADRFVIKLLSLYLEGLLRPMLDELPYYHRRGRGRVKALRDFDAARAKFKYVYKTDVKSYYASIPHCALLAKLRRHVSDERVIRLVAQVIAPVIQHGDRWVKSEQGLPLGCSLSPLLSEFYLHEMDSYFAGRADKWHYQRFADDIVLMATTNHGLKRGIRAIRRLLHRSWLTIRYRKTFTGRLDEVVCYLGYRFFSARTVGVSREAIGKARLNLQRRKSQGASVEDLRCYQARWARAFRWETVAG